MTKYRLSTKPGGELPPNVGLTIKVTKKAATVVAAPTLDCPPLLGITPVEKPVHGFNVSNFVVYIGAPLADDLEVIVTSPDVDVVAFQDADTSEVNFSSAIASVTILAGDTSALLPYYPGDTATAFTVTAQAAGYDDATTTFDITCATEIIDIVWYVEYIGFQISGPDAINYYRTGGEFGDKPTAYINSVIDDNKITVTNFYISYLYVFARIVTKSVCPGDVFSWDWTSGTADSSFSDGSYPNVLGNTSQYPTVNQNSAFEYNKVMPPFVVGVSAPAWNTGETIVLRANLNGVLIDHPRATFTLTKGI